MIDDTRTQGDKTSFNNMFEAIERIKNGNVVLREICGSNLQSSTNREVFGYLKKVSYENNR